MKPKLLAAIAILIAQTAFLASMIVFHNMKLNGARLIQLETVPYDPQSAFRGYYVDLRYKISSLSDNLLKDTRLDKLRGGDRVYVQLRKKGEYWDADAIYRHKPANHGALYMQGRISPHWFNYGPRYNGKMNIPLDYGIEAFFLNEKSAHQVDWFNIRLGGNWEADQKRRRELLSALDDETKRIQRAGIQKWWLDKLDGELDIWVKEGIITTQTKDLVHTRYAEALEKIRKVEEAVSSERSATQKPITVEVAVDRDGYGHAVKLSVDGKEYR